MTMMNSLFHRAGLILLFLIAVAVSWNTHASTYEANFKNAEIGEFIATVSKNLNKTIILDPSVKGHISVRSHEEMDEERYYQFFLSVLEVYGFAVTHMKNGVLKVIPAKNARNGVIPLSKNGEIRAGDELITRVVPLQFVTAKELAPLLRQLNDAAAGSVVHYEPGNVLLMTGRAAVIEQLMEIVENVDLPEDRSVENVVLENASATQVAELLNTLHGNGKNGTPPPAKAVADDRTNALLISGEASAREALARTARGLDVGKTRQSTAKVIYLKHAKAENLLEVLTGIGQQSGQAANKTATPAISMMKDIVVKADTHTNSLIVTAPHDQLAELESVIAQLDIDRAQVLVEAIVVEVQDADGLALGVQWFNQHGGGTQFPDAGATSGQLQSAGVAQALAKMNGLAAGFYRGNWSGLLTTLQTNSQNNILATPSIVTLDNIEAEFTVGQDVPVLTGSQTTSGDNVYQTVTRRSVGIKLKVKPQINKGDSVMMEIEQEVSSVAEEATKDNLGPTFNTRTVRNAVLVSSGNTVVVGGLLDSNQARTQNAVPVLGDIPLIGGLFRYRSDKASKRNLMLFIRPTIIRSQIDFSQSTRSQYDKFGDTLVSSPGVQAVKQGLSQQVTGQQTNNALKETTRLLAEFYQVAP
ncbi:MULTISPECIES: type II secretion system secretin GspD [Enterobacterales]|uniref:type II secretion system secretin GspD n=2 Tax=Enterobacterales TaxID=91347 RepID=UPI002571158F|nr:MULTISPECIES: type II secretion system secretin GspD [Enterobacterales]